MSCERPVSCLPVVALRGLTVFPGVLLNFEVTRDSSIRTLEQAMQVGTPVFLVGQRRLATEDPGPEDLFEVGTLSAVRQMVRVEDHVVRVLVEGQCRGRVQAVRRREDGLEAEVEELPPDPAGDPLRQEAMVRATCELFQDYREVSPGISDQLNYQVLDSREPGALADLIAQNLPIRNEDRQRILEETDPERRLAGVRSILQREMEIQLLEQEIQNEARERLEERQREILLQEKLRVIRRELGQDALGEEERELRTFREKIAALPVPDRVRERLNRQLSRLARASESGSGERDRIREYLDTVLELPWGEPPREPVRLARVREVLEEDHFGMEKVKERILEFAAVHQLAPDLKGQVLCLVGPPGVGKTSVAVSMARAMNRRLARISLGGLSDEAEIRGHRRTYVGAMPGRILTAIRHAGTRNPLILLDELDKVGRSGRGDLASALMEVLDPEQNSAFRDSYLEIPFDLSEVIFVATANTTETIPTPLLDRMELIELGSYTDEEKFHIAKEHLLPRQMARHGLPEGALTVSDEAVRQVIASYTRESGVRILERQIAALCRRCAMRRAEQETAICLGPEDLAALLGPPRWHPERETREERVGVVNGLAWTATGGERLEVEVNVVPGSGKVELTGNLGAVMKESAQAALSFIRSRAGQLQLPPDFYRERDIHVHFPEGAVPKDGPSAGIAITTAMVSALTGRPVRGGLAMTGEVTLRGRVLPVGGLREKTMAAYRCGIRTVLLPADNARDLEEIDPTVRQGLTFALVERAEQVLELALLDRQEERDGN